MRVEFKDGKGTTLYDADMDAVPGDGAPLRFPSGRVVRVTRTLEWVIGELPSQHRVVLLVTEPARRPTPTKAKA